MVAWLFLPIPPFYTRPLRRLALRSNFTTSGLSLGSHTITAGYDGDTTFASSTASPLTQAVQQATSWTWLSSSLSYYNTTLAPGQPVTFTAVVSGSYGTGAPTGFVVFYDNGTL